MKFTISLVLFVLAFIAGCSHSDRDSSQVAVADKGTQPDSEVSGATIHLYDGSRVTTEVMAERIIQYDAVDSTIAYNLDIDAFDSLGNVKTEVVGDSAIIHEGSGEFTIFGNVVVKTVDNTRLDTDVLHWNSRDDRIYTDAFVRITSEDGVISGWGMESDQRLSWYKILHRVSGEMTDPEEFVEPGSE